MVLSSNQRRGAGLGSDLRLSGGEQQTFKIGNQEELDSRREDMHRVLHSTSGMPHLEQSSSFRETVSAAGDKKVMGQPSSRAAVWLQQLPCDLHASTCCVHPCTSAGYGAVAAAARSCSFGVKFLL